MMKNITNRKKQKCMKIWKYRNIQIWNYTNIHVKKYKCKKCEEYVKKVSIYIWKTIK